MQPVYHRCSISLPYAAATVVHLPSSRLLAVTACPANQQRCFAAWLARDAVVLVPQAFPPLACASDTSTNKSLPIGVRIPTSTTNNNVHMRARMPASSTNSSLPMRGCMPASSTNNNLPMRQLLRSCWPTRDATWSTWRSATTRPRRWRPRVAARPARGRRPAVADLLTGGARPVWDPVHLKCVWGPEGPVHLKCVWGPVHWKCAAVALVQPGAVLVRTCTCCALADGLSSAFLRPGPAYPRRVQQHNGWLDKAVVSTGSCTTSTGMPCRD
eukprot:357853-Chlamydomonas_euryale.AAC.2